MQGPASGLFPLYLNPTTNTFTSHKARARAPPASAAAVLQARA
jgi:hypothetical protein